MKHKIEYKKVADLIGYDTNSRIHSEHQVSQIAASITEFGFNNPILIDENNTIIAGHGRLEAAKKLNLSEAPCVRLSHLSEAQKKAYVIADNKLALNASWDELKLLSEIEYLRKEEFNIELLGFDESELNFAQPDYSILDDDDISDRMEEMSGDVKRAIQIEFDIADYEEAQELVKWWRNQGAYVGGLIIDYLRKQKERHEQN